jgi:hypothetical protein
MDFDEILSRVMVVSGVEHEFQAAELLGFSRTAFSQRKKRGSVPVDKIAIWCEREGVNINWVLTGEGQIKTRELEISSPEEVQPDTIDEPGENNQEIQLSNRDLILMIYEAVEEVSKEFGHDQEVLPTKERAFIASQLFRIFSREGVQQYVTKENMVEQAIVYYFLTNNRDRINKLMEKLDITPSDEMFTSIQEFMTLKEVVGKGLSRKKSNK